jgi:hypothetical protein
MSTDDALSLNSRRRRRRVRKRGWRAFAATPEPTRAPRRVKRPQSDQPASGSVPPKD